jgi:hypothetical protein
MLRTLSEHRRLGRGAGVDDLRPALASSDLTRWDVLQAGWPLWRRGMRYGQRRGTPGVTA